MHVLVLPLCFRTYYSHASIPLKLICFDSLCTSECFESLFVICALNYTITHMRLNIVNNRFSLFKHAVFTDTLYICTHIGFSVEFQEDEHPHHHLQILNTVNENLRLN